MPPVKNSETTIAARGDLPLIGVVPSCQDGEDMLVIPNRYMNAIALSGAVPLVLPFAMNTTIQEALLPSFDGFLLSGGQDIDPHRYGEDATSSKLSEFSPEREETEYLILNYAKRYDVPILGICRGMQAMNVSFGGTLYQDIDDQFLCVGASNDPACAACQRCSLCVTATGQTPTLKSSHCQIDCYHAPIHEVAIASDTQLRSVLGQERIAVNSMHHQAIKEVGDGLRACAHDPEGLVEAIEAPMLDFMLGVQWHPEFFASDTMQPLFSAFADAAMRYRKRTAGARPRLRIEREERGGCFPVFCFDEVDASLTSACL